MSIPAIPTIDHAEYQKRVKSMSIASLEYVIKDCQEALNAMPDCDKAGYYADEIHYCRAELARRAEVKFAVFDTDGTHLGTYAYDDIHVAKVRMAADFLGREKMAASVNLDNGWKVERSA